MADDSIDVIFRRNPPKPALDDFLRRQKHSYFAETERVATLSDISSFYREIDQAISIIEEKYSRPPRQRQRIQHVIDSRSMVVSFLSKIHKKIIKRLHTTPNLANPWFGDFSLDIPRELFEIIFTDVIARNGYGHESEQTAAYNIINVYDIKKAKFIFKHIDVLDNECILKRLDLEKAESSLSRCEVIVSSTKPLTLKYNKNSEVLMVTFHYGYWNDFGVAQH